MARHTKIVIYPLILLFLIFIILYTSFILMDSNKIVKSIFKNNNTSYQIDDIKFGFYPKIIISQLAIYNIVEAKNINLYISPISLLIFQPYISYIAIDYIKIIQNKINIKINNHTQIINYIFNSLGKLSIKVKQLFLIEKHNNSNLLLKNIVTNRKNLSFELINHIKVNITNSTKKNYNIKLENKLFSITHSYNKNNSNLSALIIKNPQRKKQTIEIKQNTTTKNYNIKSINHDLFIVNGIYNNKQLKLNISLSEVNFNKEIYSIIENLFTSYNNFFDIEIQTNLDIKSLKTKKNNIENIKTELIFKNGKIDIASFQGSINQNQDINMSGNISNDRDKMIFQGNISLKEYKLMEAIKLNLKSDIIYYNNYIKLYNIIGKINQLNIEGNVNFINTQKIFNINLNTYSENQILNDIELLKTVYLSLADKEEIKSNININIYNLKPTDHNLHFIEYKGKEYNNITNIHYLKIGYNNSYISLNGKITKSFDNPDYHINIIDGIIDNKHKEILKLINSEITLEDLKKANFRANINLNKMNIQKNLLENIKLKIDNLNNQININNFNFHFHEGIIKSKGYINYNNPYSLSLIFNIEELNINSYLKSYFPKINILNGNLESSGKINIKDFLNPVIDNITVNEANFSSKKIYIKSFNPDKIINRLIEYKNKKLDINDKNFYDNNVLLTSVIGNYRIENNHFIVDDVIFNTQLSKIQSKLSLNLKSYLINIESSIKFFINNIKSELLLYNKGHINDMQNHLIIE